MRASGRFAVERARERVEALARAGHDTAGFAQALVEVLQPLVPHAAACVVTTDPATGLVTGTYKLGALAGHHDLDAEWARLEYETDDPTRLLVVGGQAVPARAASQLPGGPEGSVRIRELVGPGGYGDELRMVARRDSASWGGVNLFRAAGDRPFDADEVLLVAELSEAVAAGLQAALVAGWGRCGPAEAPAGPTVLVVDRADRVQRVSAGAGDLLADLTAEANRSPLESLVHGLAAAARRFARGDRSAPPWARLRSPSGRWLVAHAVPLTAQDGLTGEVAVTIDEARPPEVVPLVAAALGLTAREREVTALVLAGAGTKAIARALGVSPYTVQDHLRSIFDKAGVRTRAELVARVFFDQYAPRFGGELTPGGWFASG